MQKSFLLLLGVLFFIATAIMGSGRQQKIAVMEINDKSGKIKKQILDNAAEFLRSELVSTNKFVVIPKERQLKVMLKEEKKESRKECYDKQCQIPLGQALSADTILVPSITYFGGKFMLTCEIIDLAKEATIAGANDKFDGTEKGLAASIEKIVKQISALGEGTKKGQPDTENREAVKTKEWNIEDSGSDALVTFETDPAAAAITIDGSLLCTQTPCSKMVSKGVHIVVAGSACHENETRNIQISGKDQTVRIGLKYKESAIKAIATDDKGNAVRGELILDGKKFGEVPGTYKVPLCTQMLEIKTDKGSYLKNVVLKERQVEVITAEIKSGDMAFISAGSFMMGCNTAVDTECQAWEYPYHSVYLNQYYIDRNEVTNAQYNECVRAGGCTAAHYDDNLCSTYQNKQWAYGIVSGQNRGEKKPVVCVGWHQADSFCRWKGKRLPTEAEWEKAARGSDGRKYPWGNSPAASCSNTVMFGSSGMGCNTGSTMDVGSKPDGAGIFGLNDMVGNVWEWCSDGYDNDYYKSSPEKNPKGTSSVTLKTLRGGSWADEYTWAYRSSARYGYAPETIGEFLGFRCAKDQ